VGAKPTYRKQQETPIEPKILSPSGIDLNRLDQDARRAVQRLQSRGFEAYLVGGCVRDLLLDRRPKDFDIATAARPQQVKRTFPRNSRIIGRRFKLAHLHFDNNQKILEVSTFRRTPQLDGEDSDDLLIVRDNEFGNAQEDALRRDFTVNALFLDPHEDRIIDYAEGLEDLRNATIRTIGEPVVRFREDPVRILRAAKFSGRLNFRVDPGTLEAMAQVAPDLTRAAPPRLLEEILRLLRGAHALDSFQLLRDIGALKVILPVVADFLAEADQAHREVFWRILEALDHQIDAGTSVGSPVLLGTLFTLPISALSERDGTRGVGTITEEVLGPFSNALRLPRRDAGCLKRICGVQHRFTNQGKRRFKIASFLRDPYFADALQLFELTCMATGVGFEEVHRWRNLVIQEFGLEEESETEATVLKPGARQESSDEPESTGPKRRRRRRRRRGQDAETDGPADARGPETARTGDGGDRAESGGDRAAGSGSDRGSPRSKSRTKKDSGRKPASSRSAAETAGDGTAARDGRKASRKLAPGKPGRKAAGRKNTAKKTSSEAEPDKAASRSRSSSRGAKGSSAKGAARSDPKRKAKKSRSRAPGRVETIEPEPPDLSTFEVELDPRRVPTFGSIVEGQNGKKRRRARVPSDSEGDDYKPPPPPVPGSEPPAPDDDTFGDW
jgi:poly(A) polymerase